MNLEGRDDLKNIVKTRCLISISIFSLDIAKKVEKTSVSPYFEEYKKPFYKTLTEDIQNI